jgi:peptide/nickel transport system permease protein
MNASADKVGEAYIDIVWRQFKKNPAAYYSLWLMAPVFLAAIFAPAIASNQPFVYFDGDQVIFPWVRALVNAPEPADFLFNMALLGFFPWAVLAVIGNAWWKRRNVPGRRRVLRISGLYVLIIVVLTVAFSLPQVRPHNRYWSRVFVAEEFQAQQSPGGERRRGIYPPVPFGPIENDLTARFQPPLFRKAADYRDTNDGLIHLLGTDNTGRDVFTRMLYGTRISMTVGFVAVGIYILIGVIVGAIAGYYGGVTDMVISRAIEVMLLFPSFFLILTLVALIGPSIYIIMVVIGLTGWPTIARLIRGEVLKQRAIDYAAAARALGAPHWRIIFRHILPNAVSPALVAAPFGIAGAIIVEAGLSLLGFGVRPPAPSWGAILRLAEGNYSYWWLILFPSLAMFFTVTVFNLVGSGLRDAMDPRLRI